MADPIAIETSPWYRPEPLAPKLPPEGPAIDFALAPALYRGRATTALLGSCRTNKRLAELHGANAVQLVRLIAVDTLTGAVSHADVCDPHAAPPRTLQSLEVPPTDPGEVGADWVGFAFNADLADQLGLPKAAANYTVVAWLEDLVSPARSLLMQEDKQRPGQPGAAPRPSVLSPVNIRTTPQSPERVKGRITLAAAPAEKRPAIGVVRGSIGPGILPKVPEGVMARPKFLTVAVKTALDHRFAVHNVVLPGVVDETGCCEFDFAVEELFDPPPRPQPVFAIAIAGAAVSDPVRLDPPRL